MNINELLGGMGAANIYPFPGQASQWPGPTHAGYEHFQQQAGLYALMRQQNVVPVPTPEESKQHEIERKNRENYARWLARILREPLQDVPFR